MMTEAEATRIKSLIESGNSARDISMKTDRSVHWIRKYTPSCIGEEFYAKMLENGKNNSKVAKNYSRTWGKRWGIKS